jgi:hypothetical protein
MFKNYESLFEANARITGCRKWREFCGSFAKFVTLTAVLVDAIVMFFSLL